MEVLDFIFYITGVIMWIIAIIYGLLVLRAMMPKKIFLFSSDCWFILSMVFTPKVSKWHKMICEYEKSNYSKRHVFYLGKKIIEFRVKYVKRIK